MIATTKKSRPKFDDDAMVLEWGYCHYSGNLSLRSRCVKLVYFVFAEGKIGCMNEWIAIQKFACLVGLYV